MTETAPRFPVVSSMLAASSRNTLIQPGRAGTIPPGCVAVLVSNANWDGTMNATVTGEQLEQRLVREMRSLDASDAETELARKNLHALVKFCIEQNQPLPVEVFFSNNSAYIKKKRRRRVLLRRLGICLVLVVLPLALYYALPETPGFQIPWAIIYSCILLGCYLGYLVYISKWGEFRRWWWKEGREQKEYERARAKKFGGSEKQHAKRGFFGQCTSHGSAICCKCGCPYLKDLGNDPEHHPGSLPGWHRIYRCGSCGEKFTAAVIRD